MPITAVDPFHGLNEQGVWKRGTDRLTIHVLFVRGQIHKISTEVG